MDYEKVVKQVVLEWAKEERVSGTSLALLIHDLSATLKAVEHTLAGGLAVRPANCDCDSWVVFGRHDDWCPANR